MPDDILRALAAKGGLVGIHSSAAVIRQRYSDWSRTHAPAVTFPDTARAELSLIRSPNRDYGEYIDALDTYMGNLWRQRLASSWHEQPEAEELVPAVDEWTAHVEHAVAVARATHVGIGLDLVTARSTLRDFDARGYPRLVEAIRKRGVPTIVLGENWLGVFAAVKVE